MRLIALAASLLLATAGTAAAEPRLSLVRVAGGFAFPTHVTTPPNDPNRIFVAERAGRIVLLEGGRRETFLDIRSLVGSAGLEQGLLALAFHPEFARNGRLFVNYTDRSGDTNVVEYREKDGGVTRVGRLLHVRQPFSNHNGGQLAFGPDGLLWVGLGDGGSAGDPLRHGQNPASRLGTLLRRDVDEPGSTWLRPAYGLRNPWRFSFDRATADLYVADVGQARFDEVNFVRHPGALGPPVENFGWNIFEGRARFASGSPNPLGRLVPPLHVHVLNGNCSVIGGYVYRGASIPTLPGRYFFGDWCSGRVSSFRVQDGRRTDFRLEPSTVPRLTSFGEDARGELYLVSQTGTIFRLVGAGPRANVEWPLPVPGWFWQWARWFRGHGEFSGDARNPARRPAAAPRPIPDWAWRRLLATTGASGLDRAAAFVRDRLEERFAAAGIRVETRRQSAQNPGWALVTGTIGQPRQVRFAGWLRLQGGRWIVHYLDVGPRARQPAPAEPVPSDIRSPDREGLSSSEGGREPIDGWIGSRRAAAAS